MATYTKVAKPTNNVVIPAYTATGLIISPTYTSSVVTGNAYIKVPKPT